MRPSITILVFLLTASCDRPGGAPPTPPDESDPMVAVPKTDAGEAPMTLQLKSSAFTHDGAVPSRYTCQGDDVSIPLEWSDVPKDARSLALIVDDPDAPDPAAPKMTWVHWILFDIPPTVTSLPDGASTSLPEGVQEGLNDWKRTGWGGPCPPIGRHRYFHKLYALDVELGERLTKPTKAALEAAMEGHILAKAELIGTYEKTK